MPQPWEQDAIVGQAPVAATPTPQQFPGVIEGRPRQVAPPTELQLRADARAEQASNRADVSQQLQVEAANRARTQAERGSVEQGKTAGFLRRAIQAEADFNALGGIGARSLPGQAFADSFPNAANYISDSERQRADQAEKAFIGAVLRYDSGAAIPPSEFVTQGQIYFPRPGDSPEVLAQKAQARRTALEGLLASSGVAGDELRNQLADLYNQEEQGLTGTVTDTSPNYAGDINNTPNTPPPSGGGGGSYSLSNIATALGQGAGSIVEGAAALPGMVINPIGQALYDALGVNQRYDTGEILRSAIGLPDNPNQTTDAIIQGAAGAMTGAGAARAVSGLLRPGVARNALEVVGRTPIRDTAAGAGAGAGMVAGEQLGGTPGAVAGGVLGGLAGYGGANAFSNALAPRSANALAQAASDIGVTMLPADVGGVGTRMATGGIGRTLGGIPLAEGAQTASNTAATARNRIASGIGEVSDNIGAGQAAQRGYQKFAESSRLRADDLYGKVSVPPQEQVKLNATRGALAEITRGFQSNPELSRLWANYPRLRQSLEALTPTDVAPQGRQAFSEASQELTAAQENYRRVLSGISSPADQNAARQAVDAAQAKVNSSLEMANQPPTGGELSWGDMQRFRSIVGEIVGQPGVTADGSDIASLRKLYGALSTDMEATARATSPKAAREFSRANQYWRGRENRIEQVFGALLGPQGARAPEKVFRQINQWAAKEGGDFNRVARTIRSMPKDEADTIRATIVQRMGMARPGNQEGVAGEVFSPAGWATQWQGMSQRAKSVLFPNRQHRADLEKLARVTEGMRGATQYQNFSNTSLGVNMTAQGALAFANLPAAVALAGMQFGAGKLLASPRFARIVASTANMPPDAAQRRLTEQLGILATREPVLANDIQSVQRFLSEAAAQSPGRLAAQDTTGQQENDTRPVIP